MIRIVSALLLASSLCAFAGNEEHIEAMAGPPADFNPLNPQTGN
jgi:hypothetical protein